MRTRLTDPGAGRIEGLDGLRALAVVAVLAFHLWPDVVPGGFLGVDVFFVISGFLITTLLLRERAGAGRIDLPAFWKRRARRLLPAMTLVVLTSVAAARVVSRDLLVDVDRQALGALTFSTNWLEIFAGTDYFDHGNRSLFLTFWSLAVEEQFYLLWPPVLLGLLAWTTSARRLWRVAFAAVGVSALLMAVLFDGLSPTRVYYGTDTHLFGIMIGVGLAFLFAGPLPLLASGRWQRLRLWTGFVALVALVGLVMAVDSAAASTYRGGILIASALTAVTIAALPGPASTYTNVLRLRPLEWIGKRSYGIYLWHWPVLLIISEALPPPPPGAGISAATAAIVVAVTLVLSELSFRFVEEPFRRHGFRATFARAYAVLRGERRRIGRSAPQPPAAVAVHGTRFALGGLVLVVALAAVGFSTAPPKSGAQQSVEAGARLIDQQPELVPVDVAASSSTVPPTSAPAERPGTAPTTAPPTTAPTTAPSTTAAPAWPPDQPVPPGELIVGLGDSVLSGAAPAVFQRFPGIHLDAEPIRQWDDAVPLVRSMLAAGTMRPVVVLNFGTNGGFQDPANEQAMREVLDLLGPDRRVVLVTIAGISHWVPDANERLRAISAEYPNTVVAEWNAIVRDRPELLHSDRTHPNMQGIDVYADLLAQALDQLGPS